MGHKAAPETGPAGEENGGRIPGPETTEMRTKTESAGEADAAASQKVQVTWAGWRLPFQAAPRGTPAPACSVPGCSVGWPQMGQASGAGRGLWASPEWRGWRRGALGWGAECRGGPVTIRPAGLQGMGDPRSQSRGSAGRFWHWGSQGGGVALLSMAQDRERVGTSPNPRSTSQESPVSIGHRRSSCWDSGPSLWVEAQERPQHQEDGAQGCPFSIWGAFLLVALSPRSTSTYALSRPLYPDFWWPWWQARPSTPSGGHWTLRSAQRPSACSRQRPLPGPSGDKATGP